MANIFTIDDLDKLPKKSLERLADYYKIEHGGFNKKELVDKLLDVLVEEGVDEIPMSVRVRRIKESLKNG